MVAIGQPGGVTNDRQSKQLHSHRPALGRAAGCNHRDRDRGAARNTRDTDGYASLDLLVAGAILTSVSHKQHR
jgi:hypothetical protein